MRTGKEIILATKPYAGGAAALWTEGTNHGYFHVVAELSSGDIYEFILISISNSNNYSITGRWDIKVNGSFVCNDCIGKAFELNQPAGNNNYFKIYVGDQVS